MKKIQQLRNEITALDTQLLNLLNARGQLAQQIGLEKIKANENILVPQREEQIIEQLKIQNKGPCTPQMIEDIYLILFKISRKLQENIIKNINP